MYFKNPKPLMGDGQGIVILNFNKEFNAFPICP